MDIIKKITNLTTYLSAISIVSMVFLTCSDVFLRLFNKPILGTYELIGLLGGLAIAFGMPSSIENKAHVFVSFILEGINKKNRKIIKSLIYILNILLFSVFTWQIFIYANSLKQNAEVTLSLQFPIYPVVYLISFSFLLSTIILISKLLKD